MGTRPRRWAWLAALLFSLATPAGAEPKPALPFGQTIDMAVVRSVVQALPERLVATIEAHGMRVRRAPGNDAQRTPNPHLVQHEFVQSRLRPIETCERDDVVEARFAAAFRRLTLHQRRLFDDPHRLLDPLWRRDIAAAQRDVAADLYARIRLGQSQDAIDFFNLVDASNAFVRETVVNLRDAVRRGDLTPEPGKTIGDDDVAEAERQAEAVESLLKPVRAEIERLERYFAP